MKDLTKGNPAIGMIAFAIPIALGNLFQLAYSMADTRVVGTALGENALAAVGATTSVCTLFIGFLTGLANGFGVVASRGQGAQDSSSVKRSAAGAILFTTWISLFLTVVCSVMRPAILKGLHVSTSLTPDADAYLRVILLGLCFTGLYNTCTTILRAIGDTIAALVFLMLSSLLNIALDVLLVINCSYGVEGAAIATITAQAFAAISCFAYMYLKYPFFRFTKEDFFLNASEGRTLLKAGISMALMMSLVYLGTMAMQGAINTLGETTIVAHMAARKITEFYLIPFSFLGATLITFCGQNLGAGKIDRLRQGIVQVLLLDIIWSVIVIILSYTVAERMIYAVTGIDHPEMTQTAVLYLKYNSLFYFVLSAVNVCRNTLQGIGEHKIPLLSSLIELACKTLIAYLLTPILRYWGIILSEPIIWTIMLVPLALKLWAIFFSKMGNSIQLEQA